MSEMTRTQFDPAQAAEDSAAQANALLERAKSLGVDEAETIVSQSESIEVGFESGDLKLATAAEVTRLGLRVFSDGRMGFAATNQTDEASLAQVAQDAVAIARFSPPDEANVLPKTTAGEPHSLAHESITSMTIEEVVARASELFEASSGIDSRLAIEKASLSLHRAASAVASTAGASAVESDAALSLSLMGLAIDGDDIGGFDYGGDFVRQLAHLPEIQAEAVRGIADRALGNLGCGAAETYTGPALFSPAALLDVFVSPLVSSTSAIAVQRGRSAFEGKLGESIAHESVSLIDDPTDARLGGACRFDREGIQTSRFPIVEDGVLKSYLYNGYAAHVDGVSSTGHAAGGASAVPALGPHALSMAGGSGGSPVDMRRTLGKGLVVQRFSGSVDPASGDFSGVAKSARWVEGGVEVRPVRETLFSGNAFELLHQIQALSTETEVVNGGCRMPWALIDGISVVAG